MSKLINNHSTNRQESKRVPPNTPSKSSLLRHSSTLAPENFAIEDDEEEWDRSDVERKRQRLMSHTFSIDVTLGKENDEHQPPTPSLQRSTGSSQPNLQEALVRHPQDRESGTESPKKEDHNEGGAISPATPASKHSLHKQLNGGLDVASERTDCFDQVVDVPEADEDEAVIAKQQATLRRSERQRKLIAKAVQDGASSDASSDEECEAEGEEDDDTQKNSATGQPPVDDHIDKTPAYFKQSSSKHVTSNNTLSVLPSLEPKVYRQVLANVKAKHITHLNNLQEMYQQRFPEWYFSLQCGFNLLFYGYGSKRQLLSKFVQRYCAKYPVLVVNGYFPSCNVRDILGQISTLVDQDLPPNKRDVTHQAHTIAEAFQRPDRNYDRLYLLIHNIDGPNLQSEKAVSALSLLASIPEISVIASVDHIHAPMLWDSLKAHRFNWMYHDATTFEHYDTEMSFENSLLMKTGEDLSSNGFTNVLRSVNVNTRQLFQLLAETQIRAEEEDQKISLVSGGGDDMDLDDPRGGSSNQYTLNNHMDAERTPSKQRMSRSSSSMKGKALVKTTNQPVGVPSDIFWSRCREKFIVHSISQFRQLLKELKDHRLVLGKRRPDGQDALYIPLDRAGLELVLENMS
ncbi:hypothetical protein SeMB42_g04297 [Synchytrium endobioticum]|uniref:Origin recognition complex subunit 2 n=1 Tax=Synchytrium endobioticum TaxID=286115 RepID=A0A507D757_9FUNG|nr:hypothetical protein SeMB42_g04297 [Synchytrium endobioticum]TPX47304.1 hypothetical protein SeLEV6574_g02732 [Synchytrium endobioticum]